jgi:TatD DNase family protein
VQEVFFSAAKLINLMDSAENIIPYIDVHTHQTTNLSGVFALQNIIVGHNDSGRLPAFFSAGIHPCYFDESTLDETLSRLKHLLKNPACFAIGECGFDHHSKASPEQQESCFQQQYQLAKEHQLPIIIHHVGDVQWLLKNIKKSEVPVIIHGFNHRWSIAEIYLNSGFYLSLGAATLNPKSAAFRALKEIPVNRIFFETDEREVEIEKIYTLAAEQKNISVEELKQNVLNNFKACFGYERYQLVIAH